MADFVSKRIRGAVTQGFRVLGRTAAAEAACPGPSLLATLPVLLCIILAAGLTQLQWENRSTHLWTPLGMQQRNHFDFLEEAFPIASRTEVLYAVADNVMTKKALLEILKVHNVVTTEEHGGKKYDDVCFKEFRPRSAAPCDAWNVLAFWGYSKATLQADGDVIGTLATAEENGLITLDALFGSVRRNGTGYPTGARVLTLSYPTEEGISGVEEWELDLLEELEAVSSSKSKTPKVELEVFLGRSFDDEVVRSVSDDTMLFASAVLVLVVYLSFTLGAPWSFADSRYLLGAVGLLTTVLLSLAGAIGLTSFAGIKFNSVNALVAFIQVGVGADNLIIIVDFFQRSNPLHSLPDRMSETMAHAGTAVSLTSLSTVVAFAAGASSPLPGVASFSVLAAASFFLNYLLQVTLFPVLLALDERRRLANRHACLFCLRRSEKHKDQAKYEQKTAGEESGAGAGKDETLSAVPTASAKSTTTLTSRSTSSTKESTPTPSIPLARRVTGWIGQGVTFRPAAVFVIVAFLVLVVLGLVSLEDIPVGLEPEEVLPDDSYVSEWLEVQDEHFGAMVSFMQVVLRDFHPGSSSQRSKVDDLVDLLEAHPKVFPPIVSWVAELEAYGAMVGGGVPSSKSGVRALLHEMVHNATTCPVCDCDCRTYQASIVLASASAVKNGANPVVASKFLARAAVPSDNKVLQFDEDMQELVQDAGLDTEDSFIYNDQFLYRAADQEMPALTLQAMGTAAAAVLLLLLLLLPPSMSLVVGLTVFGLDCVLFGFIYIAGIYLNAVTLVVVVLGVGLAVDVTAHTSHYFVHAKGITMSSAFPPIEDALWNVACLHWAYQPNTQRARVRESVEVMGSSVLKGALTTLIGTVVLSGASSASFRQFFLLTLGILLLGLLTGLIFLPAFLSLVGVCARDDVEDDEGEEKGGEEGDEEEGEKQTTAVVA